MADEISSRVVSLDSRTRLPHPRDRSTGEQEASVTRLPTSHSGESFTRAALPTHAGARLDYNNPGVEPGVTREVRPESCPPRTFPPTREMVAGLVLVQFDAFVDDLELLLTAIKLKSDNSSSAIVLVDRAVKLSREWSSVAYTPESKRLLVSHVLLLVHELSLAKMFIEQSHGETSDIAHALGKAFDVAAHWAGELTRVP